jgi:hypothetical protein
MNKKLTITIEAISNNKNYTLTLPYPDTFKDVFQALNMIGEDLANWEKEILAEEEKRKQESAAPIEVNAELVE